jgi:hypothetical protein
MTNLEAVSNENLARVERAFAALQARGVQPAFCADRRAALEAVLQSIPAGAAVAPGASATLNDIGLVAALQQESSPYRYLNAQWLAENDAALRARLRARLSVEADYYLGSVQAICESGEVLGCDAVGSRQGPYVFGPPHVIWVAGLNKLVPTLEDGLRRVRELAFPLEDQRMKRVGLGGSRIGKLVIYEGERPGRITLLLVGEALGY